MKKQLTFIITALLVFEPLYFSNMLAVKGQTHRGPPIYYVGRSKAKHKLPSSPFNHPQTKERRKKAKTEQQNTINAACLVLAGILVVLPSFGFLASALSSGITGKK